MPLSGYHCCVYAPGNEGGEELCGRHEGGEGEQKGVGKLSI